MAINTDELKKRNDIADVMESFGQEFSLERRGRKWCGAVHDSLEVDPDEQIYQWYSKGGSNDGHGGDVIAFLMNEIGMEFIGACQWLANRAGITLDMSAAESKRWQVATVKQSAMDVVAGYLRRKLAKNDAAMRYATGRGWDADAIEQAQLGFWDGDKKGLLAELKLHEIDPGHPVAVCFLGRDRDLQGWAEKWEIEPSGSVMKGGKAYGMRGGMLVYPHLVRGKWQYFAGRAIDPKTEKRWAHWNPPRWLFGDRLACWNVAYERTSPFVVVVEGQADAVTLGMWGIPAVALAGVVPTGGAVLLDQLRRHEKVYVALDADDAGEKGAAKLAELLGPATYVVTWPGGGDSNDWLRALGATAKDAHKLLANAPIFALHMVRRAMETPPLERAQAKRRAFELVASLMPYDFATWSGRIASELGLTIGELNRIIRAIKTERDLAAQGVEDAKPKKEAPAVQRPPASFKELTPEATDVLLQKSRDHEGHAQCVYWLFKDRLAFVPEWGWMFYNGRHWEMDGADHRAQGLVVRTLKMRRHLGVEHEIENLVKTTSATNGNVKNTQALLERLVLASTDDFDKSPDLLNCNNGVVDLRTGEMAPHDSLRYRFTYCLPIDYRPDADFFDWMAFLGQVTGTRDDKGIYHIETELIDWLQEAVGYSLTGHTRESCLFYLYGPTRAGKGVFSQTIQQVLGKPLAAGIDFNLLVQQRGEDSQNFALAPLKPCRMLVGSEPGKYERFNEAKMKMLTGEDTVRCSFKRKDHFEYEPQFKIWLSSNWPFNADVVDDAAWGRARIITFPNSFLGQEDKTLKRRLQSKAGLEGVLAWAAVGAKRWYEKEDRGGLQTPPSVVRTAEKQREEQDFIQHFIDECCERDDQAFIPVGELYKAYYNWCSGSLTAQKAKNFSQSIRAKGYKAGKKWIPLDQLALFDGEDEGKKQVRGYWGLKLTAFGEKVMLKKVRI